jgi:hypothetical protein
MADTKPNGGERRAVEREASSQLTTLTSVLAGFGFAWFAILVDKEHPSTFTVVTVVVSALTIFVLVLASVLGSLLTIASQITVREGPLRWAETLWTATTKTGLLLFVATVALLPYRVDPVAGVVCSVLAALVAVTVIAAWAWIKAAARPGAGEAGSPGPPPQPAAAGAPGAKDGERWRPDAPGPG